MKKKSIMKKKSRKNRTETVEFRSDDELKQAEKYLGDASRTLPLPQSFFVTSILGLIISATFTIYGTISPTWGFAFCLIFVMMFIASFVSIHPRHNYS